MAYGKTNVEQFKNEEAEKKKKRDEMFKKDERFFFNESKGPVDLIFCPPYAESLTTPHLAYKVHYNLARTVTCPTSFGEPCPICDVARDLYKKGQSGDKKSMELNIKIYARPSYYYNVIPYVAATPYQQLMGAATHCATFAQPKEGIVPAVKIFRCGKKAHGMVRDFLQFNGDIFDPEACNIINLSYIKQASQGGGVDDDIYTPMLNIRPQKCRLHDGFMKMLQKAGTKVEDGCMYDLQAVLLESKPNKDEVKALIDAKVAEWFAVPATQSVTVPSTPAFGGAPAQPAMVVPPQTAVTVSAPPATGAVPTVTPAMVAPPPATVVDPLAAFAKGV